MRYNTWIYEVFNRAIECATRPATLPRKSFLLIDPLSPLKKIVWVVPKAAPRVAKGGIPRFYKMALYPNSKTWRSTQSVYHRFLFCLALFAMLSFLTAPRHPKAFQANSK